MLQDFCGIIVAQLERFDDLEWLVVPQLHEWEPGVESGITDCFLPEFLFCGQFMQPVAHGLLQHRFAVLLGYKVAGAVHS